MTERSRASVAVISCWEYKLPAGKVQVVWSVDCNKVGDADVGDEKDSKESSSNAEEVHVVGSLGSILPTGDAEDIYVVGSSGSIPPTGYAEKL